MQRNRLGMWIPATPHEEMAVDQLKSASKSKKRNQNNALQRNPEDQEAGPMHGTDSINKEEGRGMDQPTFDRTVSAMKKCLPVAIWATKSSRKLAGVLRWILVIFIVKAMFFEYCVRKLSKGLLECAQGRNSTSCSELKRGLFPSSITDHSYQLKFQLSDPDELPEDDRTSKVAILYEFQWSLQFRNPIFLFGFLVINLMTEYILSFLHKSLLAIDGMVEANIPNPALPEGPPHQLHRF
jgi:hypothetical protein